MIFLQSELSILIYWIRQREWVRKSKAMHLPRPWTEDPLLRDYRWCNVRRMDDRVSQWLMHWYVKDVDPCVDLAQVTLGRLVNWPAALIHVSQFDNRYLQDKIFYAKNMLTNLSERGFKIFTGAYIVPGVPGRTKIDSVIDTVSTVAMRANAIIDPLSMKNTWANLCDIDRLGSFLAGQIVADVAHLKTGHVWFDQETWAPLGPGSKRGMNRLLGRNRDTAMKQSEFETLLPELIEVLRSDPIDGIDDIWHERKLQAMDIQNCLCEFDKYCRLTLKEGTVRARYDGKANPEDDEL